MTGIQFPIKIDCKIKQCNGTKEFKFKILGCFHVVDRLDKLTAIPQTPHWKNDYWLASKMLCEEDGGRLPSDDELAVIATLVERKIIDLPYGYYWSSVEVSSSQAWRRTIRSNYSYFDTSARSTSSSKALCVKEL